MDEGQTHFRRQHLSYRASTNPFDTICMGKGEPQTHLTVESAMILRTDLQHTADVYSQERQCRNRRYGISYADEQRPIIERPSI